MTPALRSRRAYTLLEITISTAVSSVAFLALAAIWIPLQRSYFATDSHSENVTSQLRALDFISRDARAATSVVSGAGALTLILPDYYATYDADGNGVAAPVWPTISAGSVSYNNAALPLTVVYAVANGALTRQLTVARTGTTVTTVICSGIDNLSANLVAQSGYLSLSLSFSDRYRGVQQAANSATTLTANVYLRNLQH